MSETIIVEAVSDKFKNKYSAGSVLAGGKWLQVSSKLKLEAFKRDTEMTVETKTNDKGYTSIVGIVDKAVSNEVEDAINEARIAPKKKAVKAAVDEVVATTGAKLNYEDAKNKKILVQGITQAAMTSTGLAGVPYTTVAELSKNAQEFALAMIEFVKEQIGE